MRQDFRENSGSGVADPQRGIGACRQVTRPVGRRGGKRFFFKTNIKKAALSSIGAGIAGMVVNPWLLAELFALGLEAVAWTLSLRRLPLSIAYPFMSLAFGLNLLAAWLVFGEVVAPRHWIGISIIVVGVMVTGWEDRNRK